jgi:hypothetical protein
MNLMQDHCERVEAEEYGPRQEEVRMDIERQRNRHSDKGRADIFFCGGDRLQKFEENLCCLVIQQWGLVCKECN